MALWNHKKLNAPLDILIWKIEESEEELLKGIDLFPRDLKKLEGINHPHKRKEFLALRQCLKHLFNKSQEVAYSENGKPFLKNGPYLSFSHTHGYAALIASSKLNVGIDIEVHRAGIKRIAPKFLRPEEAQSIEEATRVEQTTFYWGAKEVMVKIEGDRRLDFKRELSVDPFQFTSTKETTASYRSRDERKDYKVHFEHLEPLYLTFGWQIN